MLPLSDDKVVSWWTRGGNDEDGRSTPRRGLGGTNGDRSAESASSGGAYMPADMPCDRVFGYNGSLKRRSGAWPDLA